MPRVLKTYYTLLVIASAIALVVTSLSFAQDPSLILGMRPEISLVLGFGRSAELQVLAGLAFWIVVTLFASALPVQMPRGTLVSVASRANHCGDGAWWARRGRLGGGSRDNRGTRASRTDSLVWNARESRGNRAASHPWRTRGESRARPEPCRGSRILRRHGRCRGLLRPQCVDHRTRRQPPRLEAIELNRDRRDSSLSQRTWSHWLLSLG